MSPKEEGGRGWDRVGYSDMIYLDGSLINLTPFNQDNRIDPWEMTWGARGFNSRSRHVVYVGGLGRVYLPEENMSVEDAKDTRTAEQLYTMEIYVKYMILRHPGIKILGHNQVSSKACPSFHVPTWLDTLNINKKNIYYREE